MTTMITNDYSNLSKTDLLLKCSELGINKCNSKNKSELIILIENKLQNQINKINNVSPLRYPGGKTRACKIIDDVISNHFDIKTFDNLVSPFFGGGSFEFYFQNKYNLKLKVNDK